MHDRRRYPSNAVTEALDECGFAVLPEAVGVQDVTAFAEAYDAAVAAAAAGDVRVGSTTTRVSDFVNRGAPFDEVYVYAPLLAASRHVIGGPFKLSSLHARTLRPRTLAQELHVDVRRDSADWPLVGFILMVDGFHPDNGATRLVPGSHRWPCTPQDVMADPRHEYPGQVLACGAPGSLLIFNGSVWHGATPNTSDRPRRSLQGAFIPRGGQAATDFAGRMNSVTRERLSLLARDVLAL
jgi:ectoine hydroxylase-related dioxygenase (phytanoyl-CoA dioxygenase family)